MLKKLQNKFILTNMILVGIVLFFVLTIFTTYSYSNAKRQLSGSLRASIAMQMPPDDKREPSKQAPFDQNMDQNILQNHISDQPSRITLLLVSISQKDGSYEVIKNTAGFSDDMIAAAVSSLSEVRHPEGTLSALKLSFSQEIFGDKTLAAFADDSYLSTSLLEFLMFSLLIFALAMVIVYFISLFIAMQSIRPIREVIEAQKRFVADASHELKTPLTVILANNSILLKHESATVHEQRQWIDSTLEEATHMKKLIEDMLFLAKSEVPSTDLPTEEINLSTFVIGCSLQFEPLAFEKGIHFETDVTDKLTITGNSVQIRQLIMILLDNAVKYCDKSGTVSVCMHLQNSQIILNVKNTGVPISSEDLPHIFDRFYRSDVSRTNSAVKGYGLGLSIAKNIAEHNHGQISVESNEEIGTKFTIIFKSSVSR